MIGPDGKVSHVFEKVTPKGHAQQVCSVSLHCNMTHPTLGIGKVVASEKFYNTTTKLKYSHLYLI